MYVYIYIYMYPMRSKAAIPPPRFCCALQVMVVRWLSFLQIIACLSYQHAVHDENIKANRYDFVASLLRRHSQFVKSCWSCVDL